MSTPPLPAGYALDQTPPLPAGYQLDQSTAPQQQKQPATPKPTALQRFSQVTLGTQHPITEFGAELKDIYHRKSEAAKSFGEMIGLPRGLWSNPSENIMQIGGTGIPGMIFGEQGLIKHPLSFLENFTGANQAAEDVRNKNYAAVPGSIVGGLTNLALAKKPVEAGAQALAEAGKNAKVGIAEALRTPENKLKPITAAGARIAGAAVGHTLGMPGEGELAGIFTGPSIADAFLPKRPEPPNLFGGAYSELGPLEGQSVPMTESPNYLPFLRAKKAINAPPPKEPVPVDPVAQAVKNRTAAWIPTRIPKTAVAPEIAGPTARVGEPQFSGSEGRAATWTNEDVIRLAQQGNREAISQAIRRGMTLPENARYIMGDPDVSRAVYNPRETTSFTPEGTPIRNLENPNVPRSSRGRIQLPWEKQPTPEASPFNAPINVSTDTLGVRWATDGTNRVSIPRDIPPEEVESYARPKLAEQAQIRSKLPWMK